MANILFVLVIILILVIAYLIFTRRKKYSVEEMKFLILDSHNKLKDANKNLSDVYNALKSLEQGRLKGGTE